MYKYAYAYRIETREEEVFFHFPQLPEIISALPVAKFRVMSPEEIQEYATDAVLTALQARISGRIEIPSGDNQDMILNAYGFVNLSIQQSLKLELFNVYKQHCKNLADLSRKVDKKETAVRRLLDLRHQSWVSEIETAMASLGVRVVPTWHIEAKSPSGLPPGGTPTSGHLRAA